MKIKKLILNRNVRLSVKNIDYIEINPTDPVQLILGPNGVGKSSLISECTPLPARKEDYKDGGYKEVHIYHDGSYYICISSFAEKKQRHSMVKDNVELNDGGTVSTYKELVEQEFGITQDMHEILTMQQRFTTMPTTARRYWFTKLANNDFNYVIGVYNKLKSKHNDISGTVKTLKKRLVMETEKIVDIDYQNALQKEVDELYISLNELLEQRKPLDETPEELRRAAKENADKMLVASITLIKHVRANRKLPFISYEDIEMRIAAAVGTQNSGRILSDQYLKDISRLDESIDALERTGQNNIQDMLAKILTLQMSKAEAEKQISITITDEYDPEQIALAVKSVEPTLYELSTSLPANPDKAFSRATYTTNNQMLESFQQVKVNLENELNGLQARKKHQELHLNTEGVECPQCRFKWHLGYSESAHKAVMTEIEEKSAQHETVVKQIAESQKRNTEILEYFAQFKRYTQLVDNWPILLNLWNYLSKDDVLMNAPSNIPMMLERFARCVQLKRESAGYEKQIIETKNLIDLAEKVVDLDIDKLKKQRQDLDEKLFIVSKDISTARENQNDHLRLKTDKQLLDKLHDAIRYHVADHSSIRDRLVEATRRTIFNECVHNLKSNLARKELAIQEIRGQRAIITDIENQIMLLSSDEIALKLIVDEMSPKDGLIAEGILGFIKVFIGQLNNEIAKVWTYPLVIQACDTDEASAVDLDYKFPVSAGQVLTPDVGKCSKGQMEIMDICFMVLFMKHLGLGEFPVMLDEPAVNMDNQHRIAATNYIKNLIEKRSFTQLFMINHYDSIYGAFTNAQVTVMHEDNVVLPKDCVYNQHVTIR